MSKSRKLELVCPAGTPGALRVAVDAGADAVYFGFRDETNARNFPGLNFSRAELNDGIRYAHAKGAKALVAINTFARSASTDLWRGAVDAAARSGADAVILCDIGVLDYAARTHPSLRLHLSVQAAAATPEAIGYYVKMFGVRRVVLPRVLTVDEIARINAAIECETEAFVFGGLCVMAEGRCSLSSYATGKSPNMHGVCSPASHVTYRQENGEMVSRLGDFTINRIKSTEPAAYPTLCKGRFATSKLTGHLFEEPVSLNAAALLPLLMKAGVTAVKIEGRQRGRAYVEAVVKAFRSAIDGLAEGRNVDLTRLLALAEGQQSTQGAYAKTWRDADAKGAEIMTTLTIGPVLFKWSEERWRDFYFRVADEAPVDFVCVGEAVCSKRLPFFEDHLPDVIERLERAGRQSSFRPCRCRRSTANAARSRISRPPRIA